MHWDVWPLTPTLLPWTHHASYNVFPSSLPDIHRSHSLDYTVHRNNLHSVYILHTTRTALHDTHQSTHTHPTYNIHAPHMRWSSSCHHGGRGAGSIHQRGTHVSSPRSWWRMERRNNSPSLVEVEDRQRHRWMSVTMLCVCQG